MAFAKKIKEMIESNQYLFDDREFDDFETTEEGPETLNKIYNKKNIIKYTTIKNGYVTKEQAVAIAGCDRNLKDSIFKDWKSRKMYLGWISFEKFDVALVQLGSDFAWHVKVKSGSFGGCENKKILGITYKSIMFDGEFDEDSDISCLVMCNSGQYYYSKDIDMSHIKAPNMKEYEKYLKQKSVYHS